MTRAPSRTNPRRMWPRSRVARAAVIAITAVLAVNLAARALDAPFEGSSPQGDPSSAYATSPEGAAAYAELLTRFDHPVERRPGSLADLPVDGSDTLVVLDPRAVTPDDAAAVLGFVTAGGRLVIGGATPGTYLGLLRDDPPQWRDGGPTAYTAGPDLAPARTVVTAGHGSWADTASATPIASSTDATLVAREPVGSGEILYVADPSFLQNRLLASADNAAAALALAGEPRRRVVFAEGVHGVGARTGLAALPPAWKLALVLLAAAGVALIWSRARRLGPPDPPTRRLAPPRRAYVDALAASIERAHDPGAAVAPVQVALRAGLAERAHLPHDARDDDLRRAADAAGLDPTEIAALLGHPTRDDEVLALGRALARLATRTRRGGTR